MNVVLNAQLAGDDHSEVQITTKRLRDKVLIRVSDSDFGVPAAQLRTLFRPFQMTKQGGFGIGLCQSKQLIEAQGGKVRVESVPGRGTSVAIELPAADPVPQEDEPQLVH